MHKVGIVLCLVFSSIFFFVLSWIYIEVDSEYLPENHIATNYSNLFEMDLSDSLGEDVNGSDILKENKFNSQTYIDTSSSEVKVLIKETFETRKEDYFKNVTTTHKVIQMLTILVCVGMLLLFYRPKAIDIPFISMAIPETLVYLFTSVALIYLWTQFGLSMNASVDSRYALHFIADNMESVDKDINLVYSYSIKNSFVDNGIVDNWCGVYKSDTFNTNGNDSLFKTISGLGLFGLFGILFGVVHGISFILIIHLDRRLKGGILTRVLFGFTLVMFLLGSTCFVWKFPYAVSLISWIWFVAGFSIFLWYNVGYKIADRIEKANKEKTKNIIP